MIYTAVFNFPLQCHKSNLTFISSSTQWLRVDIVLTDNLKLLSCCFKLQSSHLLPVCFGCFKSQGRTPICTHAPVKQCSEITSFVRGHTLCRGGQPLCGPLCVSLCALCHVFWRPHQTAKLFNWREKKHLEFLALSPSAGV